MPTPNFPGEAWNPVNVLQNEVRRLNTCIDRLTERVEKVETRMNVAIGGIGVLGVTGIVNLITNILQASGGA